MTYVDAGYVAALGGLCLYGIGLLVRRRRWERALRVAERAADDRAAPAGPS